MVLLLLMISEDRFYYNLQQRGVYGVELEPIIKVDKLVKTYDGNNVVDGVSFEVKKGEIWE